MKAKLHIGTSGWHYNDWIGLFYPPEITGYEELTYHANFFNSVENNSSFYHIAGESTYKTWYRMTPNGYTFSMKLNKLITHIHKLQVNSEVYSKVKYILNTTQILKEKLGTMVIQLPASFAYDLPRLDSFLSFVTAEISKQEFRFSTAIEFRNKQWFTHETYTILQKYNTALVTSQSLRYPEVKQLTADIAYIRMHGPEKLFDSKYTSKQLEAWAQYIKSISSQVKDIYIYFNNDFHGYALDNARELKALLT